MSRVCLTGDGGEESKCLGVGWGFDQLRDEVRENHLTLDGHDLLQTVQGHLTPLGRGEVIEEGSENLIKDTRP